MKSVKRNIIANYFGNGWNALMMFIFIPLYIHYLGIEAYGLIGVFAMLQSWLFLLDMGMTPTLSREMARFEAGAHTPQSINDLLCSLEWIYLLIAVTIAFGMFLAAPWLASGWLRADKLSTATVANALAITGILIAMRWFAGLYRGAIVGLQRQVWLNGCSAIFSALRGLGVVAVLAWISPTIQVFFIYQSAVAALEVLVLAVQLHRLLPPPPNPARFQWESLHKVWRFAAGMTIFFLQALLLTQVDKLLLSKLLLLSEFSYYILASTLAGGLYMAIGAITNVAYPRFSELIAREDISTLTETYHKFSQLIALIIIPTALVLALFSKHVLLLWTRNSTITSVSAPLLSLIIIGNMLNGLTHIPFFLQLAYGWIRFSIIVNIFMVLVLVPAILMTVPVYGVTAAPIIWIVFNTCYILLVMPLMHCRLLSLELWRWYGLDVFLPGLATFAAVWTVSILTPAPEMDKPLISIVALSVAFIAGLVAATWATPLGRNQLRRYIRGVFSPEGTLNSIKLKDQVGNFTGDI